MARESYQRSLDRAWRACNPAPRTMTELWQVFAALRGIPNTLKNKIKYWDYVKGYYNARTTQPVNPYNNPRIHEQQGRLF